MRPISLVHCEGSSPGFYPPDEVIPAQTSRNREAVLRLLEISDCPYKAIAKETQYCGISSTTIFSDDFETARGWTTSLSFSYYLAHGTNSSSADYLRVKVKGATTSTVFEELGAANNDNGAWASASVNLNAFAGQSVQIVVEAADASTASLVEAAIDNVIVKR